MPPDLGQIITFIIGTVVILFGAYYVTYFVGMKASGRTRNNIRNKNIRLVDRYAIARDKQFCIIEIAGKVYIVAITNNSIALLDTLDAAAFAELTENDDEVTPWNMTPVGQYGNRLTKKVVEFIARKTGRIPNDSETGGGENGDETDGGETDGESGASGFSESLKKAQRTASETSSNSSDTGSDSSDTGSDSSDTSRLSSDTLSVKNDKSDTMSENQPVNPEDD